MAAARRVLDLGTGSGCIAISIALERPESRITATVRFAEALEIARGNAQRLGARNVEFQRGDWLGAVGHSTFDLVVSNPPNYFALNPAHPLYERFKDDLRPNDGGWKIHEAFYRAVSNYLTPGALLIILEIETLKSPTRIESLATGGTRVAVRIPSGRSASARTA